MSQSRHVVYDGDCSMCRAAVRFLVAIGYARSSDVRPFVFYDPDTAARLMRAGIHNELSVWDPERREVRGGARGLLWKLEEGPLWPLAKLLALPGPLHLCTAAYRVISYNRRILAPLPPGQIACACDPDPSPVWRGVFVALCLGIAAWIAVPYAEGAVSGGGLLVALLAGIGLALPLLTVKQGGLAGLLDRAGNLAWVTFVSSLWLLPFGWLAGRVDGPARGVVLAAGAVACLGTLARMCVGRFGLGRVRLDPALRGGVRG